MNFYGNFFSEILSRATSITEALKITSAGSKFWKVRNKGDLRGLKLFQRTFKIDMNHFAITYTPNKAINGKNCVQTGSTNGPSIDLRDVSEVRIGHSTDTFNSLVNESLNKAVPKIGDVHCHRDLCFSVIFKDDSPNLDLIAKDQETRNTWVDVIQHLVVAMQSLDEEKKFKMYLRKQFKNADKNGDGALSLDECQELVAQLNIKFPEERVKKMFEEADFLSNQEKGTLSELVKLAITFYFLR